MKFVQLDKLPRLFPIFAIAGSIFAWFQPNGLSEWKPAIIPLLSLIMFGMGGIMVEVLKDVSFYLAPLTANEAKQMLIDTKTYKILKGVRGQEGVDIERIAEGLQRLSQLVTEFPQILEMDINPYVVGPIGTTPIAVDARMSLEV